MTLEEMISYYLDNADNPKFHNSKILNTDTYRALQELKFLREKYKNVSEAFMKVNNSIFDTKMDLNKVKQELNKVKQELQTYKKAYETVCNSLSDKTSCNWGYDDACKFCQEEGPEYRKTTSCVDNIKNFYLQKARE